MPRPARSASSSTARPVRSPPGGADTVDHLGGGENRCGVHEETLGATTDNFDGVFENVDNFLHRPGWGAVGCRRTAFGLVCPLASLAARPPVVAVAGSAYGLVRLLDHRWLRWAVGVRPLVSSVRSLRSLLDHRWLRSWSRLSARFARCSTTGGCGDHPSTGVVSRRSLRSLLNHRKRPRSRTSTFGRRTTGLPGGCVSPRTGGRRRRRAGWPGLARLLLRRPWPGKARCLRVPRSTAAPFDSASAAPRMPTRTEADYGADRLCTPPEGCARLRETGRLRPVPLGAS